MSQLKPSVRAATGTSSSTRPYAEMSVGLTANPASSAAGAITSTLGASSSGSSPSARKPRLARKRRGSGERRCSAPYSSPASALPSATRASRTPAPELLPRSSAKAIIATSTVPNSTPTKSIAAVSVRRPGTEMALRWPSPSGWTGGSVVLCATKAIVPAAPRASATSSPTAGSSTAQSTTTSGPSTKTTSSTTASQA